MLNTADHPLAGAVFLLWALASSVVAAGGQGGGRWGFGGCGTSLKGSGDVSASINSSFQQQFLWSMPCFWTAFYPQLELSKLELVLSDPATALSAEFMSYSKSSVVIWTVFTVSSPGVDSILNHFLCASIKSNSQLLKFYHSWQQFSHVFRLHFFFPCCYYHICSSFLHWSLEPLSHHSNKTMIDADILTSSHESWIFLMASRMVNPWQVSSLFCWDLSEESLSMAALTSQNVFL